MPWWAWLIVVWLVLVTPAALYLGAVAAKARERERARRHRVVREGLAGLEEQ